VSVHIEDPKDCYRFVARVVRGVRVGPSPAWLASALEKVGVKPINNIVDVTNYVMLEFGQPLHGYDLDALPAAEMGVRRARRGERLQALDGRELSLDRDHLVITAKDDAVGVAGVIGGMATRITETTVNILIESAAFDPRAVRRTRRSLNLNTDASYRFERGSDREVCRRAADRATALITQIAGGAAGAIVDEFPAPNPSRTVTVRRSTVKRLLGESLSTETIAGLLDRLELRRTGSERDAVTVAVPSFRWDLHEEADLVEEVARLYGYENIGKAWHYRTPVPSTPDPFDRFVDRVANHLVARGMTEVLTSSFSDGREARWFGWPDSDRRSQPIAVMNPLTSNQALLRTHLLPGVLDAVARNLAHGRRELYLFAVGPVFLRASGASGLPDEPLHLVIARTRPAGPSFWRASPEPVDLFEIKTEVESLLATHRPRAVEDLAYDFEPTRGTFRYANRRQALIEGGVVPAGAARELDLAQPLWYADIDLTALYELHADATLFHAFSEFPASRRDLSLVAPGGVAWGQIEKHVAKVGGRLLESLQVFDVFRGASVGADRTAYGVRLAFRSADGTLTDADVDAVIAKIVAKLEAELGVVLRS
jgi:phenylalanyl-tRNA synthetase beta chain